MQRRGKSYDIKGRRFGRLVALRSNGVARCWQEQWVCRCDCGREVLVYKNNLLSGHTHSCGCLRRDMAREQMIQRHEAAVGHTGESGEE